MREPAGGGVPSCSAEYKGDAWHLAMCGMAGGKSIPATVTAHPCTFATLTAPSFGPVHGLRHKGRRRARRDRPLCPHGRAAWCIRRHCEDDPLLGELLCYGCYDYRGKGVWPWHAPEPWCRTAIACNAGGPPMRTSCRRGASAARLSLELTDRDAV